jgi:ATP citrate (pro-S)-lyase
MGQVKSIFVPTEQSLTAKHCAPLIATLPLEIRGTIEQYLKGVFAVFQGKSMHLQTYLTCNGSIYDLL